MQKVECEIKGLTPYYFNKYLSEKPGKGENPEKEHARKTVYQQSDILCFPSSWNEKQN